MPIRPKILLIRFNGAEISSREAQYSDSTVDPFQKQITAKLTKLEELLRECKNELDGEEYCNIEARLVEAETLIRSNGDWINFPRRCTVLRRNRSYQL